MKNRYNKLVYSYVIALMRIRINLKLSNRILDEAISKCKDNDLEYVNITLDKGTIENIKKLNNINISYIKEVINTSFSKENK